MNRKITGINILVESRETEGKTSGGIVLPDSFTDNITLSKGVVIKKGPGYLLHSETKSYNDIDDILENLEEPKIKYIPLDVEEGDTVYYNKKNAETIILNGKHYYIIAFPYIKVIEPIMG